MGQQGFLGCPIPGEYGRSSTGFVAHTIITEEISMFGGSLRAAIKKR
jgi:alkylation response protein AidB-like acyl-CoA dehydrogenase